ncbi:Zinc metalloproteinase nas-8-like protein [Aphelenchoides besseyi]|nr:Zinc metalloproteinase nas-8-like protein [Aphelenchoides besseyi]
MKSFTAIYLLVAVVVIVQSKSLNKREHVVYNTRQKAMIQRHKQAVQNGTQIQMRYGEWFAQRWPGGHVPYVISDSFSFQDRQEIIDTLRYLESVSCFQFEERRDENNYVEYVTGDSCWSSIGMQGGYQKVILSSPSCIDRPDIMHETMHALGLSHEHQRHDRDKYVRIHMENVMSGSEDNFDLANFDTMGLPYDYYSIMHYHSKEFSKNERPTITAKRRGVTLKRPTRLSRIDLKKLKIIGDC